jgi:hypothetical protein
MKVCRVIQEGDLASLSLDHAQKDIEGAAICQLRLGYGAAFLRA